MLGLGLSEGLKGGRTSMGAGVGVGDTVVLRRSREERAGVSRCLRIAAGAGVVWGDWGRGEGLNGKGASGCFEGVTEGVLTARVTGEVDNDGFTSSFSSSDMSARAGGK